MPASEHTQALATIRTARTFLVLLALLAPATHVASWAAIQFGQVLEAPISAEEGVAHGDHAGTDLTKTETSDQFANMIEGLLPITEFIGRCAILLLIGTMLLGVLVCVSGKLGGIHHFVRAFYYAIIVGAMFVPWERVTRGEAPVFGVFTTMDTLRDHYDATRGINEDQTTNLFGREFSKRTELEFIDGMRFGMMPFFAMFVLLVAGRKFGNGIRAASKDREADIPMTVV